MWVRSQNKELLVDTKTLGIRHDVADFYQILFKEFSDQYIVLGEYSTTKKALKVLDMIQKEIEYGDCINQVFQMPLNNEVEEDADH